MRKVLLAIGLALLMTAMVVSPAMAAGKGAIQASLYPCGPGQSNDVLTNQPAQGKVIINTPNGNVTLNFTGIVNGLSPNTEYRVFVRDFTNYTGDSIWTNGYWAELLAFTTSADGTGSFHLNILAADLPAGAYNIQIAINPAAEELTHTVLATVLWTSVTVGK